MKNQIFFKNGCFLMIFILVDLFARSSDSHLAKPSFDPSFANFLFASWRICHSANVKFCHLPIVARKQELKIHQMANRQIGKMLFPQIRENRIGQQSGKLPWCNSANLGSCTSKTQAARPVTSCTMDSEAILHRNVGYNEWCTLKII